MIDDELYAVVRLALDEVCGSGGFVTKPGRKIL